jgi:hypothetical protein
MKGFLKTLPVAALVIAGVAGSAQAGGITGSIQFTGGTTNDTMSLITSTTLESFTGTGPGGTPVVQFGDSGSYGGVLAGTPVTFDLFTFTGPGTILPTTLWQFTTGGETYSFVADTITSVAATSHIIPGLGEQDFLNITGSGIASISGSGLTPTRGTFTITESGPPGATTAFNFGESLVVPEPSVLALVGMAVVPFAWRYVRKAGRR